jgi:hypothetical protein
MCLIIKKPANRRIAVDFLENAWQRNCHGWGSFHVEAGRVVWSRGMRFEDLVAHNAQLPLETEVYLHLRYATYGHVNEAMAHPYEVRPGLMLMHNGSIHHLAPADTARSDTHELARMLHNLLDGLSDEQAAALIRSRGFVRLTAPLIHGSMVILLDGQGAVHLGRDWHVVQAHEWDGVMPGIEVSNTHAWRPKGAWRLPAWRPALRGFQAIWGARARRSVA